MVFKKKIPVCVVYAGSLVCALCCSIFLLNNIKDDTEEIHIINIEMKQFIDTWYKAV